MSALALIDLSVSKDLDAKAMASIKGGDEYSYIRSTTTLSAWGASTYNGQTYYGQLFRNGYLTCTATTCVAGARAAPRRRPTTGTSTSSSNSRLSLPPPPSGGRTASVVFSAMSFP
jgi:hypothetical protein